MKIRKALLCAATAFALFGTSVPATAAETSSGSTQAEIQEHVAFADNYFDEYGVDQSTQDRLLDKIRAGKLLDGETGKKKPVSLDTTETEIARTTVATYPDGSITVTELELPKAELRDLSPDAIGTRAVGQCTNTAGGSGYRVFYDCTVSGSNSQSLTISFRATYGLTNGGSDYISSIWGGYQACTGCQATEPSLAISRQYESSAGPATAYATGSWTRNRETRSYFLYMYVGGDSARTQLNS